MKLQIYLLSVLFIACTLLKPQSNTHAQSTQDSLLASVHETMEPRKIESNYYNELWTYHIRLDNGYQIIYTFTLTEFGSHQKRNADVKFQTSWKDGKTIVVRKKYENNEFKYDSTTNLLKLHPGKKIYAKGKFPAPHRLVFKARKDGHRISANFEIQSKASPILWQNGHLSLDNDTNAGLTFPLPHGNIKGTLVVNNDTLKNASGTVYMDHIYMTNTAYEVYDTGYRIKSGNAENGFMFTAFKPRGSSDLIGYGIEYENGTPHLIKPMRQEIIKVEELRDIEYARKITIHFNHREPLTFQIDSVYNNYTVLDEYGMFKSVFAKKILGGKLIQFNGRAHTGDGENVIFNNFVTD